MLRKRCLHTYVHKVPDFIYYLLGDWLGQQLKLPRRPAPNSLEGMRGLLDDIQWLRMVVSEILLVNEPPLSRLELVQNGRSMRRQKVNDIFQDIVSFKFATDFGPG